MYELIIDSGKVKRMKEKMKQQIWRKKGREGRMKCFEFYRAAALEGKVEKIYHEEEEQPSHQNKYQPGMFVQNFMFVRFNFLSYFLFLSCHNTVLIVCSGLGTKKHFVSVRKPS